MLDKLYKRFNLKNGIRVVTEHIPYVNSISIGVWIEVGSKNENKISNGASHFIEHMLFKGTDSRDAKNIANTIDNIGGHINAFTSKECTCYHVKVLDSHYKLAIDLLSDILLNSKFEEIEIEKERSVIMEELSMYEDSPEDLSQDMLSQTLYSNHPLGMSIIGTRNSLSALDRKSLLSYMKDYYVPENIVISVAGNFEEDRLIEEIERKFGAMKPSKKNGQKIDEVTYNFKQVSKIKDIEQTHYCLGFKGVSLLDKKEHYPLLVVNNLLGGSMSSRLFQKIREENGLTYSIYSYPSIYKNGGSLNIYAGTNSSQLSKVRDLIFAELKELVNNGITTNELNKTKEQLKGNYILGLESTSSRMSSIGKSELLLNKIYSPKEIIKNIDNIDMNSIDEIITKVIDLDNFASVVVSNVE
ncbi:MAG: insulinase family protein [Clostridiales bacterium]|nr:insulinase family protein [Clostridiales bacterium]